jgi:2-polyprenyl-3-methyl-5-hydroxy-6-metoxy-1,4-benzoquinol methylase
LGLLHAQRPRLELTGVDFSATALRLAAATAPHARLTPIDFLSTPILPVEGWLFDCVVSSHVVEHVPEPVKHLAELWRLVKPGGRLIVNFPVGDPPYELHLHNELEVETVIRWVIDAIAPQAPDDVIAWLPVIKGEPNDNGIVYADKLA